MPFFHKSGSRWLILGMCVALICVPVHAQYKVAPHLFKQESIPLPGFYRTTIDTVSADTAQTASLATRPTKSTLTAILLSAALPGAGQIYTERYWKVPIILGFSAYFISLWIRQDDLYVAARAKYQLSVDQKENNGQGNQQFLYERDFYRDQRDRFAFYIGLTYILNILDAYVGASLYNFEVTDNLGGGAALKIQVPIR
ncbi:MAG: hypothetical protein HY088_06430 [Ignavibacteriales bacterium]|nr:hypothetical protein [Ignavibacteriales bacterium]